MTYLSKIEALLFVAGEEGLSLRQLSHFLEITPSALKQQLEKLSQKYQEDDNSSLCLIESSNSYKIVTKENFADLLQEFAKTPINQSLTRASLEVLSIIAYKQPITRIEIDDIRGVNSSSVITKLQAYDLIREDGKKEVIGRPNLYITTDYFLDFMGINDITELPDASTIALKEEEVTLFKEPLSLEEELGNNNEN
ncbi:SMC-Scp complex subunit ScpB [Streptococcus zalophi]|uniref:Segregation and condensation protein B n=1 Tax=Streptococcus zalophi TaxID=640031 RepID=A0A934UDJ5_9STRE|nr:SMC-Scp complex subunit ScpB [Streptococcus zalophi]MBJ8349743.1 segregation/condensation protein B [Streptococcus zalophi]MCR8967911.1 SMC-Scp complex subunit ScpB [Streptococcus zalophi]